jgi:hypothetical protein
MGMVDYESLNSARSFLSHHHLHTDMDILRFPTLYPFTIRKSILYTRSPSCVFMESASAYDYLSKAFGTPRFGTRRIRYTRSFSLYFVHVLSAIFFRYPVLFVLIIIRHLFHTAATFFSPCRGRPL